MWLGVLKKFIEVEPLVSGAIVVASLASVAYVVKSVLVAIADIVTSPFKAAVALVTVVFQTIQVVFRGYTQASMDPLPVTLSPPSTCCEKQCCTAKPNAGLMDRFLEEKSAQLDEILGDQNGLKHPLEHRIPRKV